MNKRNNDMNDINNINNINNDDPIPQNIPPPPHPLLFYQQKYDAY